MYFSNLILNLFLGISFVLSDTPDVNYPVEPGTLIREKRKVGEVSSIDQFPHLVALYTENKHDFCVGTIVSPGVIVTSAHCFKHSKDTKAWFVRAGSSSWKQGGSEHRVRHYTKHPKFNPSVSRQYDVAVVQLETPIPIDNVKTKVINLFGPNDSIDDGVEGFHAGWGSETHGGAKSDLLHSLKMKVVTTASCSQEYDNLINLGRVSNIYKIAGDHVCAVSSEESNQASCQGDSGGPLVIGNRLAAVSTFGFYCSTLPCPNVFVKIPYVHDWIELKIRQYDQELSFDPRADAQTLRNAMEGWGTKEEELIRVLANRDLAQRLEIAAQFKSMYNEDLVDELKSETSWNFEDLLVAMMTPINRYYAQELNDAMGWWSTDKNVLIDIMCTKSNEEIKDIKQAYLSKFNELLKDDLIYYTSGDFEKIMVSLNEAKRDENTVVDKTSAEKDAVKLFDAGINRWGTDEDVFINIFTRKSREQLKEIIVQYAALTFEDIGKAIEGEFSWEFSGDVKDALQALYKTTMNKAAYFAEQLHESMKGPGTNDPDLIRLVVTISRDDMQEIKKIFKKKYGETLESAISSDTSGDYEDCLLALIK